MPHGISSYGHSSSDLLEMMGSPDGVDSFPSNDCTSIIEVKCLHRVEMHVSADCVCSSAQLTFFARWLLSSFCPQNGESPQTDDPLDDSGLWADGDMMLCVNSSECCAPVAALDACAIMAQPESSPVLRVVAGLGQGGFGCVVLVEDSASRLRFAMKVHMKRQ